MLLVEIGYSVVIVHIRSKGNNKAGIPVAVRTLQVQYSHDRVYIPTPCYSHATVCISHKVCDNTECTS